MSGSDNILAFQPRKAPMPVQSAPAPKATQRSRHDAEIYRFAAAILRAGYRQFVEHASVTVPKLNAAEAAKPRPRLRVVS